MKLTTFSTFPPGPVPDGVTVLGCFLDGWVPLYPKTEHFSQPFGGVLMCALDSQGNDRPDIWIPEDIDGMSDDEVRALMEALGLRWVRRNAANDNSHLLSSKYGLHAQASTQGVFHIGTYCASLEQKGGVVAGCFGDQLCDRATKLASRAILSHIKNVWAPSLAQ